MIDADVTELIARVPFPAGADMLDVVLRGLERIFLGDSGLAEARPSLRVPVAGPRSTSSCWRTSRCTATT